MTSVDGPASNETVEAWRPPVPGSERDAKAVRRMDSNTCRIHAPFMRLPQASSAAALPLRCMDPVLFTARRRRVARGFVDDPVGKDTGEVRRIGDELRRLVFGLIERVRWERAASFPL